MEEKEKIKVFICYENGHTTCICTRARKGCDKNCALDVVERDRFRGWEDTFEHDRYGRSKMQRTESQKGRRK